MNKDNSIEIKISEDGSHTLYVKALDEHYHSVHGAIQESLHVFIKAGLQQIKQDKLSVLEFGFGTGLNAFLTAIYGKDKEILYHSMEKYPVDNDVITQLNYGDAFHKQYHSLFQNIHQVSWNKIGVVNESFQLLKEECDFKKVQLKQKYNLIYFDAFAPEVQPALWTREIFQNAFNSLLPGGCLVTYCAKGVVRRTMQEVGFVVERLPGPPGKREMLRAWKESLVESL